jgi:hypothetical protein
LEFACHLIFFFKFHELARIHEFVCIKLPRRPLLSSIADSASARAVGSRLADARKHRHWHLTSSEHMSSFKTDGSECQHCQGDCIVIRLTVIGGCILASGSICQASQGSQGSQLCLTRSHQNVQIVLMPTSLPTSPHLCQALCS